MIDSRDLEVTMKDFSIFINDNCYCSICLKTNEMARLVFGDYDDFFEAVKISRSSPWLCAWCAAKVRHFYDLRIRAHRSQRLLQNIRFAPIGVQNDETSYSDELHEVQQERMQLHSLVFGNDSHALLNTIDSENIPKKKSKKNKTHIYSHKPLKIDRRKKPCPIVDDAMKMGTEVKTERIEDNEEKRKVIKLAIERTAMSRVKESPLLKDMLKSKFIEPRLDPLDHEETWDVCENSVETTYTAQVNDAGPSEQTTVSAWKVKNQDTGQKDKAMERAESLRCSINTGKGEIVINETDDTTYILADTISKYVIPHVYTDEDVRTAHSEIINSPKYKNMKYKCERCAIGFGTKYLFEKHEKKHSATYGKYKCDLCETYHATRIAIGQHMGGHYRAYECAVCSRRTSTLQHATNHYLTQHATIKFRCARCDKSYKSLIYLKKHFYSHTKDYGPPSKSKCEVCQKVYIITTYEEKYRYLSHVRSHTEGKVSFLCTICKETVVASRRSNHMKRHAQSVLCPVCDKTFRCKGTMELHRDRVHAQQRKYQCHTCGKLFFCKSEVRVHIEWTHLRLGGVVCPICGLHFRKPYLLRAHTRTVHEKLPKPKNILCDICGKGFCSKRVMENHRMIHTGERPHACEYCGQKFRQQCAKRTHIKLKHLNYKWSDLVGKKRTKRTVDEDIE